MTPEQQRIAIAEACGWRVEGPIEGALWNIYHNDRYIAYVIEPDKTVTLGEIDCIPDYLNDLNAMREAVMAQSRFFQARFSVMLSQRATIQNTFPHALTAQDWADVFFQAQGN